MNEVLENLDTSSGEIDLSAFIPGLEPYGLGRVPGYRTRLVPGDAGTLVPVEDPAWREEWFAWRDAVNALRLEAEGYGDQHPIGDNATSEGRAKNRRISVRVTER